MSLPQTTLYTLFYLLGLTQALIAQTPKLSMETQSPEFLVIKQLADECKARVGAEERFGIHYTITEDFGAIVLACRAPFLTDERVGPGFKYPRIFRVTSDVGAVYELPLEYTEIEEIEAIVLAHAMPSPDSTVRDPEAYAVLMNLIRQYYPNHPIHKEPPVDDGYPKQMIINNIPPLLDDSLLLERLNPSDLDKDK